MVPMDLQRFGSMLALSCSRSPISIVYSWYPRAQSCWNGTSLYRGFFGSPSMKTKMTKADTVCWTRSTHFKVVGNRLEIVSDVSAEEQRRRYFDSLKNKSTQARTTAKRRSKKAA